MLYFLPGYAMIAGFAAVIIPVIAASIHHALISEIVLCPVYYFLVGMAIVFFRIEWKNRLRRQAVWLHLAGVLLFGYLIRCFEGDTTYASVLGFPLMLMAHFDCLIWYVLSEEGEEEFF